MILNHNTVLFPALLVDVQCVRQEVVVWGDQGKSVLSHIKSNVMTGVVKHGGNPWQPSILSVGEALVWHLCQAHCHTVAVSEEGSQRHVRCLCVCVGLHLWDLLANVRS